MVIDLTPGQEARVRAAAEHSGRDVSDILTGTALWLLKLEEGYDEALERSIAQADRGEFVDEDAMQVRFERMMQPR